MPVEDFSGCVAEKQSSPEALGGEKELKNPRCGIAGGTVGVQSRESYLGMVFIDTFGLLGFDGQATICNQLLHL